MAESASRFFQAQPWEDHTEMLLQDWAGIACKRSKAHESLAEQYRLVKAVNIPLILLAVVFASVTTAMPQTEKLKWWTMIAFLVLGIGQGLLYTLDASGRLERHLNVAGRYMDIASDISETLARPVRCRPPADVFCCRIKTTYESLNRNAPYVPSLGSRFQIADSLLAGARKNSGFPNMQTLKG